MEQVAEIVENEYEVPDVLLTAIRDGVVSLRTCQVYIAESFNFLKWCQKESPTALSPWGLSRMNKFVDDCPVGITNRKIFSLCCNSFDEMLRGCDMIPVIAMESLAPEVSINYARQLRNKKSGNYLGRLTIGIKRAALFHLF
jgi:hypothetical protein